MQAQPNETKSNYTKLLTSVKFTRICTPGPLLRCHEDTGFPAVLIQQPISEFTPEFPVLFFQHTISLAESAPWQQGRPTSNKLCPFPPPPERLKLGSYQTTFCRCCAYFLSICIFPWILISQTRFLNSSSPPQWTAWTSTVSDTFSSKGKL